MAKDDVNDKQDIKEDVEVVEEQPETPKEAPKDDQEQEGGEDSQDDTSAEDEPANDPEEKPPSRREQLRINTLLEKYGDPRERVPAPSHPQQLDYSQALDAEPEVVQQLQEDRQRVGEAEYNRGQTDSAQAMEYMQFYNNVRFDLPLVTEKLSKLDPDTASAIDKRYLQFTGTDTSRKTVKHPEVGYADYVDAEIEFIERAAKSMTAQSTKNIARQSAMTGLRPDGSSSKRLDLNKAPGDMTMEELYAVTGAAGPKLK